MSFFDRDSSQTKAEASSVKELKKEVSAALAKFDDVGNEALVQDEQLEMEICYECEKKWQRSRKTGWD